jgi:hypothetical protein
MMHEMPDFPRRRLLALIALACLPFLVHAQANYEIQVYGAQTVSPETLMVELHSQGEQANIGGVYPTYHQEHETIELTEGLMTGRKSVSTSLRVSKRCPWGAVGRRSHPSAHSRT